MIIELDPFFAPSFSTAGRSESPSKSVRHSSSRRLHAEAAPSRAEREASFEQAFGSLWSPSLLDRLTSPLTRYHD